MAKCLRCGAGNEWIQGRASKATANDASALADKEAEIERLRKLLLPLLDQAEIALVNFIACGHPECDMGVCTHPLRLIREARAALEAAQEPQ